MTPDIEDTDDIGLEERQTNTLLKQMQTSLEDLDGEKSLGFDDFSFDNYRQELFSILQEKNNTLSNLPNGIFSGCHLIEPNLPSGMIALLGVLPKVLNVYVAHELLYIGLDGKLISNNQKYVLEILNKHKNEIRFVPNEIDNGDKNAIQQLQQLLMQWQKNQNAIIVENENGEILETAGTAQLAALQQLQKGNKKTIAALQEKENMFEKKYDLITWLVISNI
jgi:hypothetical protein